MGIQAGTIVGALVLAAATLGAPRALAAQHGDEAVKPIATEGLEPIGKEWVATNPYSGNPRAVEIGKSAYNQNCARCHGLEGISGGFAPDLRQMQPGKFGDELFALRVRNGVVRNGITYMPKMAEIMSQESLWAVRSWLETKRGK